MAKKEYKFMLEESIMAPFIESKEYHPGRKKPGVEPVNEKVERFLASFSEIDGIKMTRDRLQVKKADLEMHKNEVEILLHEIASLEGLLHEQSEKEQKIMLEGAGQLKKNIERLRKEPTEKRPHLAKVFAESLRMNYGGAYTDTDLLKMAAKSEPDTEATS